VGWIGYCLKAALNNESELSATVWLFSF